ncbi:MAG TPA: dCTP deaminase [Persephonella sp.]|uniref:dCTP deaminase, dUMP-forming n=1 Tax=Persephonella marina (strain DSM 14350 / EX-H1) TaxID=123214 RepID=DCDB_PERMH|nr:MULTISPECIES: dCTP deaminase [Persephonella]C0QRW3.1 RecName: Full=dCTP deaminase, dUMP-forming; AltName: Full=Bifunctional dCTP deaminase:dUTPase; AltName: Full=DCD-DUT [Persephonella marina EX-H1]ACO03860.1 deoxycytidine triphosphate deaminase [Persephonella marina EX-H1]HCB69154.1 dCTP deaminase [Persephonella sp.]
MILNDRKIRELIESKELLIDPLDAVQIQPSSVDLRLGNDFLIYPEDIEILDVRNPDLHNQLKKVVADDEGFIIQPKQFILATTREYIKLPDYLTAFVEGRSSLGRLGLFIENAGWVDAGFEGNITLEFYNANSRPLKIYPGMRICQLVFAKMEEPAENPYRGKYQGQRGTTASRIFLDKD